MRRKERSLNYDLEYQTKHCADMEAEMHKMQKYYEDQMQQACFREECLKNWYIPNWFWVLSCVWIVKLKYVISENSSTVQTPQHDLDPLMVSSVMSGISAASSNQVHQLLLGMDPASYLDSSHESLGNNLSDKRNMQALKCELSLDLNSLSTKLHSIIPDLTVQRLEQNLNSPNNSNFTDNTSQFGYQHLQRQLSIHSPAYEEYQNTPSNINSRMKLVSSPLKAVVFLVLWRLSCVPIWWRRFKQVTVMISRVQYIYTYTTYIEECKLR
uniref:Uncharacterized protein n=1 Tax=Glossina brevipalpis TaxID=37001 RepID=A0A1A9W3L1_9MUSC